MDDDDEESYLEYRDDVVTVSLKVQLTTEEVLKTIVQHFVDSQEVDDLDVVSAKLVDDTYEIDLTVVVEGGMVGASWQRRSGLEYVEVPINVSQTSVT